MLTMVRISAAQPTIFGYKKPTLPPEIPNQKPTPPPAPPPRVKVIPAAKAPVMPPVPQKAPPVPQKVPPVVKKPPIQAHKEPILNQRTEEEQNIKDVRDAIRESSPSAFNSKTFAAGAIALTTIAYLAYQNYKLKSNLTPPPPPIYTTGPGISDKFTETPGNLRWMLDPRTCIDVLSYGEEFFATGNKTQLVSSIFDSEESTIERLSQFYEEIKISLGDHCSKSPKSTILGALIEHECVNTLTHIEPLFPKFSPMTILNSLDAAAKAANVKILEKLIATYEFLRVNNPSINPLPQLDRWMGIADPQPEFVTVKVNVGSKNTPKRNSELRAFQEQLSNHPRYESEQKKRLISIFKRSKNQPTAVVKQDAERTLELIQICNPELASKLYRDPELNANFQKYGIFFKDTQPLGIGSTQT